MTCDPWAGGSALFQRADDATWPSDLTGRRTQPPLCDLIMVSPGRGKALPGNMIAPGVCLPSAVMGSQPAKRSPGKG